MRPFMAAGAAAALTAAVLLSVVTPSEADLNESAASLCAELGGTWTEGYWCDIEVSG